MSQYRKYLKPVINSINAITDFSQVDRTDPQKAAEYPYLESVIRTLNDNLQQKLTHMERLEKEIEDVIHKIDTETGDDKSEAISDYNRLLTKMEDTTFGINRVLETIDAPYFGKIIFDRRRNERFPAAKLQVYIGKFALFDPETNRPLITDWRAPIANLYYENSGPTETVSFMGPVGEQKGALTEKKQFEISQGRISTIYNAQSGNTAADEFLLKQLKTRIGKKLKDIVATIQSQQNEIIRDTINKPVFIQGVAGSGKTTIILHRLAYLFYTYTEKIKPENSLIIAPNRMFLDYISDVLPSLGVKGLEQNTFLFWARDILQMNDKNVQYPGDNLRVKEFKGSYQFKKLIDLYIERFEKELFEEMPGSISVEIEERYKELKVKHPGMSMIERIDLSIEYAFAQQQFKSKAIGNFMGKLELLMEKRKKIRDFVRSKTKIYNMYTEIFKRNDLAVELGVTADIWQDTVKHSLSYLKQNKTPYYQVDDLAAMVWLHFRINGYKTAEKDYIVVDEAQDLSIFQLLTLRAVARNGNITVAGDVAQSIIPPFYIKEWEEVIEAFRESFHDQSGIEYYQLFRCYRTTIEIIGYANQIFKHYFPESYKLPEAVLRHGDAVKEIELEQSLADPTRTDLANLTEILEREKLLESASIAIICKNPDHADKVFKTVSATAAQLGLKASSYSEDNYQSGILVLPVERAKGLEFDAVLIADLSAANYQEVELDIRLLYVSVTRALHRLYVMKPSGAAASPVKTA